MNSLEKIFTVVSNDNGQITINAEKSNNIYTGSIVIEIHTDIDTIRLLEKIRSSLKNVVDRFHCCCNGVGFDIQVPAYIIDQEHILSG